MEPGHSQQQLNVTSYGATVVAIMTLQTFAGMWINAFIVSVFGTTWVKKKTLNSSEKILLFLGCSRFWYLGIAWLYYLLVTIHPYCFYVSPLIELIAATDAVFQCSNTWVSAYLCVFYCIKIANFKNSFFIYLKVKIDRIVPWLLLGSLLLALAFGIVVYNAADKTQCDNLNSTSQGNYFRMDEHWFPIVLIFAFVFATAFMAVLFSALLLLSSLWTHKRNMQKNSMKDLSVDAHIKAMKFILSFLVMYSINFIIMMLSMIYSVKNQIHMMFPISVFLYAFPSVESLILIFSNPKLEKTMLKILSCVKCKICMR